MTSRRRQPTRPRHPAGPVLPAPDRARTRQHGRAAHARRPAERAGGLPTDGGHWAYEVKWDGCACSPTCGRAGAPDSRRGNDVTVAFPELAGLAGVHSDVLLDGEVVVLRGGVPSFAALAERFHVRDAGRAAALAASPRRR